MEHISIHESTNTISQWLTDPHKCITIVSDGGNIDDHGSFGWIITNNHTTIFENHGTARGTPMSSFRAEAYGKLSWIIFLKHYTTYYHITPTCQIISYLDNLEVVKRTSQTMDYTRLSTALFADYDILIAIHREEHQLLNTVPTLQSSQHVKGHQDDITAYRDLTRPAQLNIRADELATLALQTIRVRPALSTTPNPHCSIYLKTQGHITTSREKTTLQWKWAELQLQLYYERILHIPPLEIDQINWAGMCNARKTFTPNEINFSMKLTTNWLPVGENMTKRNHIITLCHRCQQVESVRHLFCCTANKKANNEYIENINTALLTRHTDPHIRQTIIHGIKTYISIPSKYNIPAHLQYSYDTQTQYGWNLVCAGLLLQAWSQHQQQYINNLPTKPPYHHTAGDAWNKHLSITLTQQAYKLWTTRCSEVHNSTEPQKLSKEEEETIAQLHRFYEKAGLIAPTDRKLIFSYEIDYHIQKGHKHIKKWIQRNAKVVKKLIDRHTKNIDRQRTILQYFKPMTHKNIDIPDIPITQSELNTRATGC